MTYSLGTSHAMSAPAPRHGNDAALRWIGDLDHPFYDDERNRFVWYEAQAIGFQFIGFGSYLAAAIALLIGGANAIPYVIAMITPFVLSVFMLKGYVTRRGADYWPQSMDFRRSRGLAVVAIMALLAVGFVRAFLETDTASGSIVGMIIGGAAAGAALALGGRRKAQRELEESAAADLAERDD